MKIFNIVTKEWLDDDWNFRAVDRSFNNFNRFIEFYFLDNKILVYAS